MLIVLKARLSRFKDELLEVLPLFEQAESMYSNKKDMLGVAKVLINKGEYYRALANYEIGQKVLNQAEFIILNHNLPLSLQAYCLNRQSAIYNETNQLKIAESTTRKLIQIAQEMDNKFLEASGANELGVILEKNKYIREATFQYARAIALWKKTGHNRYWTNSLAHLARIYLSSGRNDECIRLIESSLSIVQHRQWHAILYTYYDLISRAYIAKQEYSKAFEFTELAARSMRKDYETRISKELAVQQAQYEVERRAKQIEILELESEKSAKERNLAILIGSLILLLLFFTIVLFIVIRRRNQQVNEINHQLNDALTVKEALLKDLHHRVKNNLSFLIGLVHLQGSESPNTKAKAELAEVKTRLEAMALIHSKLLKADNEETDVHELIKTISEQAIQSLGLLHKINIDLGSDRPSIKSDRAINLGVIINELIVNSFKHAFHQKTNGEISIKMKQFDQQLIIDYSDNGPGYANKFDLDNPVSVGLKLIKLLILQLKGNIDYQKASNTIQLSLSL